MSLRSRSVHERDTARLYTPQPVRERGIARQESACRVQGGRLRVCTRHRQTGQLMPGTVYRIEFADGSTRHGNLDACSCLREEDVPGGPVRIVLLGGSPLPGPESQRIREESGLASPVLHSLAWSHGYALEGENIGLVVGVLGAPSDGNVCFEVMRQGSAEPLWAGTAPVRQGRATCNWLATLADGSVDRELERHYADYWFRVRYSDAQRQLHAVAPLAMRVYSCGPVSGI